MNSQRFTTMYAFDGDDTMGQLSFGIGETIVVQDGLSVSQGNGEWGCGTLLTTNKIGWFPIKCVKPSQDPSKVSNCHKCTNDMMIMGHDSYSHEGNIHRSGGQTVLAGGTMGQLQGQRESGTTTSFRQRAGQSMTTVSSTVGNGLSTAASKTGAFLSSGFQNLRTAAMNNDANANTGPVKTTRTTTVERQGGLFGRRQTTVVTTTSTTRPEAPMRPSASERVAGRIGTSAALTAGCRLLTGNIRGAAGAGAVSAGAFATQGHMANNRQTQEVGQRNQSSCRW